MQESEQLPGYEIGALLHESSTSIVHRARRVADGVSVVVKRTQGNAVSARQLTRYRNEYELLRSLDSDGFVKVHDLVRHGGRLALVFEEFDGISLKQWLLRAEADVQARLAIAVAVAATLADVHARNIIHKDVNSHNILYEPRSGRCKLIDFGIATRLRSEECKFQFQSTLEGTLAYIAPEQTGRMNRSVDYRADLYSLGVTLYELFTGCLPHSSEDPLETVHFHIAGKPTPPNERAPRVPEAVSDIIMKLLQKAPEDRYQSAAGVAADLRVCAERLDADGRVARFPLGAQDLVDRFEPPQKLYGREAQAQALLTTFERIASGSVETVLVSGPGGIGKTSLVHQIHTPITLRRGYFAAGKFDVLQQDAPFRALVMALQDLVEQLLTESEDAVRAWREAIQQAVSINGQVILDVIPTLELIIGPQPPVPPLPGLEAQNRFKLVFQSFIQVLAQRDHPLVLFLDDMQWADAASLNLLTGILAAPATESLLVVQAYRDNEVTPDHPFMAAVKDQENCGVSVERIQLQALEVADIARFVADSLHQDEVAATPLAAIIHEKTGGNPFFARQFLERLYADKLVSYDPACRTFRYDTQAIAGASITENVAELLGAKLEKLDCETQRALRLAAAIGHRFDLDTLAAIDGVSAGQMAALLPPALEAGLIVPLSRLESLNPGDWSSPLVYRRFGFLHNRVQSAAYAAIPPEERARLHLAIGRALLGAGEAGVSDQRLFDVVNQLNLGASLIADPAERLELAKLNVRAGARSRNATAYELAGRYLRQAIELMGGQTGPSEHEKLSCDAHIRLAECLCLTGSHDEAFAVIDSALGSPRTVTDITKLHALKLTNYLTMGQMPEALSYGRLAAEELGVDLPERPERVEQMLEREIGAILEKTSAIGIENLLELPLMDDPAKVALMELMMQCLPAAYQTNQQLFALICCKMVGLSLEFGNCPLSARAYGSFAALLSSALGRFEDAYRFAKLAADVAHLLNDPSVFSGAYFLWAMFASHWNEPIDKSIDLFSRSVEHGLQTGDHLHAGYSAARRVSHLQFKGAPLAEVREEASSAFTLLRRIADVTNQQFLLPRMRFMAWLMGDRPHGDTLGSDEESERQCAESIRARGNKSFESDWYILLVQLRYLSGDYRAALEVAETSEQLLPFSAGFVTRAEHALFYSLTVAALYSDASEAERERYDAIMDRQLGELKRFADQCSHNYGHFHLLAQAEHARVRGKQSEAMRLYDLASATAAEHGFVHIEALAAELAARYWRAQGKSDFSELYVEKALHAYEIWGAFGKAADLRKSFGGKGRRVPALSITAGATTLGDPERGDALDLATVLKASQVISGEILLDRLLATLLDIMLENAGGEVAALLLEAEGEFFIQGFKDVASGRAQVMSGEPLKQTVAVSKGIVNYVIRTREHVVLDDPALRGRFRSDGYVRNRRPKSVLCAPIVHKGRLTGIVYLENNHLTGAFTSKRLESLKILMSQIAVSIENATLYARQEQQARSIELANEALTREITERKHAEQELSRYKDHLEELVAQRTRELESAQGRLVDLSRRAGMAEVASGVLHNVGNVMNSVNVGANVARDAVKALQVGGVTKVAELLEKQGASLAEYLISDPAGRKVPEYLRQLGRVLANDQERIRSEIDHVLEHLEHMKKIIAAQQSHAKVAGVTEVCTLRDIAETALAISEAGLRTNEIRVVRDYGTAPPALLDRHQIMQILVNLISNAKHALEASGAEQRVLTLALAAEGDELVVEVRDNGIGIPRENLSKIFNHGFTTKKNGHGFGLHNCANAAQQMGGSLDAHSDGAGRGARFVLRVPARYAEEVRQAGAA